MELLHELYGAWNTLRTLGFKADDLFVQVYHGHVCMTLHVDQKTDYHNTFRIICGNLNGMSEEALFALWQKWCADIQSGKISDKELDRIYRESAAWRSSIPILVRLIDRGLRRPRRETNDGTQRGRLPADVHGSGGSGESS